MEKINNTELGLMVSTGAVSGAIATNRNGHYELVIETPKKAFIVKTKRGLIREFKTLTAVEAMLGEVGIQSFSVIS